MAYLFSPCSLLTFPLRGKAVLFSKLGCPGFLDSSTTASHGSNGAGLRPLWCRFLTRPSKPDTGPHRGEFVFSPQKGPLPLKGEGLGIVFLGLVGFALLVQNWVTLAQQGLFGASLVSFPYSAL